VTTGCDARRLSGARGVLECSGRRMPTLEHSDFRPAVGTRGGCVLEFEGWEWGYGVRGEREG
jgi:hypothetical protein